MRFTLIVTLLIAAVFAYAQTGFIQTYEFEGGGISFDNMLLKEDTLILYGTAKAANATQWGLYFAKLDTLGNILSETVHYDENGRSYAFEQGYKIIFTSDGGYAITGLVFEQQIPSLFKLNVNGEVQFVREYPDTTTLAKRHWNIIETNNGYLSTGGKQQADDGLWDTFIMRTDPEGNKLWEINYGESDVWDRLAGINRINDNEYLITGSTFISSLQVNNYADLWSKTKAIKIDTMGQIIWEWEGELEYFNGTLAILRELYPASDGNWINTGADVTILEEDRLAYQPEIVKRDTNFNVLWATSFGEPTSNRNYFANLASTSEENWVAVGQYVIDDDSGRYRTSIIAKVSAEGDSLWSRTDTLFNPLETASTPYLSGVVVLPSGSIITCGRVDKTWPAPAFSIGWLIKVDKNGCIEPGCNPLVDGVNLAPMLEGIQVFPNPTADFVQLHSLQPFTWELYDGQGRQLGRGNSTDTQAQLDLRRQPTGVYYVRIRQGRLWGMRRVVKSF
ncbi:MAG: T9SS type A sorting domain-containing protein [Lewinella sp.]|uniref:T9SS type A sorting domain-containing protein n=1 Tax=Lewinella sp. TaxID=2004506 RepID=UPI003D6B018D